MRVTYILDKEKTLFREWEDQVIFLNEFIPFRGFFRRFRFLDEDIRYPITLYAEFHAKSKNVVKFTKYFFDISADFFMEFLGGVVILLRWVSRSNDEIYGAVHFRSDFIPFRSPEKKKSFAIQLLTIFAPHPGQKKISLSEQ